MELSDEMFQEVVKCALDRDHFIKLYCDNPFGIAVHGFLFKEWYTIVLVGVTHSQSKTLIETFRQHLTNAMEKLGITFSAYKKADLTNNKLMIVDHLKHNTVIAARITYPDRLKGMSLSLMWFDSSVNLHSEDGMYFLNCLWPTLGKRAECVQAESPLVGNSVTTLKGDTQ